MPRRKGVRPRRASNKLLSAAPGGTEGVLNSYFCATAIAQRAALYAFSRASACPVACFAHVSSTVAQIEGDFEKGETGGALDALNLISAAAGAWIQSGQS